jgi:tRNA threonylcarbamoyl adenosine modification protein (Sua5/YciO/YrdC/YwlC family)
MEEALTGYLEGRNIAAAAAVLRGGGVAVLPTDTIYGLHCVYSNAAAIERIRKIKGRSKSTGFILLASSVKMADKVVNSWPGKTKRILGEIWPAPITAILPAAKTLPAHLRPKGGVAVRIPAVPALLKLIKKTGEPLVSTSVNLSGDKPVNRIGDIRKGFPGLDAYLSRRGPGGQIPSTVVDVRGNGGTILRKGSAVRGIERLLSERDMG